ncbi:hypothetical protein ACX0G7_25970 [Flavitalea antarctica]
MKDSLRRLQYESNVMLHCRSIDTTAYGKDSVVVEFKSKDGKLLKTHTKEDHQSDRHYGFEKTEYFNTRGRPEFVERWELARSSDDDDRQIFTWKVYSYERFVYDSTERVVASVRFYPAFSGRRVLKYEHTYLADGTKISTRETIEIEKFWD